MLGTCEVCGACTHVLKTIYAVIDKTVYRCTEHLNSKSDYRGKKGE
jgi:hypothetical protein